MDKSKLTIAVDFDGVLNNYKGYKGKGIFEEPVPGAREVMMELYQDYNIIINTTRAETWLIEEWLNKNRIPFDYINHSPINIEQHLSPSKLQADMYIDDRAIHFDGDWEKTFIQVKNFKLWHKK